MPLLISANGDFRLATRQLVALGSQNTLYAVSIPTGTLTAINTAPFTPTLNGSAFGIDFNPTVDPYFRAYG